MFQSGYPIVHSQQQRGRVPLAPRPRQHLVLSMLWVLAILTGVWLCPTDVLTCISVMPYHVEHLFIGLYALCVSAVARCLLMVLDHIFKSSCFLSVELRSI